MKKALSIILSVLVIFSMFSMAVSAADSDVPGEKEGIVTVKFVVDGVLYKEIKVMPGVTFNHYLIEGGVAELGTPTKASTETTRYIFKCWKNEADGTEGQAGNIPAVPVAKEGEAQITEVTYTAVFVEEDIVENQTFWAFIQTIFERINMIFEYFAKVFEGVFEF